MSNDEDDEWDGALGEREGDTVSPDMVRKLLAMNPALRNTGMNTASAMNVMSGAKARAEEAPQAKKAATSDIFAAVTQLKAKLKQESAVLEQLQRELDAKKKAMPKQLTESFCAWLSDNDPDVRSPVTQKVLQKEVAFFNEIGFSLDAYIDKKLK